MDASHSPQAIGGSGRAHGRSGDRGRVDHAASQLEAKREQTMREVRGIFEETHRAITPFLTAEQQTKLGELEQRHHRRFHRRGFMRPPPPGPSS